MRKNTQEINIPQDLHLVDVLPVVYKKTKSL